MKLFLNNLILIIIIFVLIYCKADFCQYNFSIFDLKSSSIEEVISFIKNSDVITSCENPEIDNSLINFWLYTNTNKLGTKLNAISPKMSRKKTIVLIPGWLCNITNDLMPDLTKAYLKKYHANVIIVDWSYYAAKTYGVAFCHMHNIAKTIAGFLIKLETNLRILINTIHIVGHSMGGQLAGLTGQYLQSQYNKTLSRITGLDPAGPLFIGKSEDNRLDKTDAQFVDVIHTNAGVLGYLLNCGHVDFYPGCGIIQNGCPFQFFNTLSLDFVIKKIGCDHLRSVDYMIESISTSNFTGRSCPVCVAALCLSPSTMAMGEHCTPGSSANTFYLQTNGQRPFAEG